MEKKVTYYDVMRGVRNMFDLRLRMVKLATEREIFQASRHYDTTWNALPKWLRRYREQGLRGLEDRSRSPKHIPHKTPKAMEVAAVWVVRGRLSPRALFRLGEGDALSAGPLPSGKRAYPGGSEVPRKLQNANESLREVECKSLDLLFWSGAWL